MRASLAVAPNVAPVACRTDNIHRLIDRYPDDQHQEEDCRRGAIPDTVKT